MEASTGSEHTNGPRGWPARDWLVLMAQVLGVAIGYVVSQALGL
ncbi:MULTISPECIES: hypothetical protein [Streptomyces]